MPYAATLAGANAAPFLLSLLILLLLAIHASDSTSHHSVSRRKLPLSFSLPSPAVEHSIRSHRYIIAENSRGANTAPASAGPHRRTKRHRVLNFIIWFTDGSLAGLLTGLILSALFRMLYNCIRGRYRDPGGHTSNADGGSAVDEANGREASTVRRGGGSRWTFMM